MKPVRLSKIKHLIIRDANEIVSSLEKSYGKKNNEAISEIKMNLNRYRRLHYPTQFSIYSYVLKFYNEL